MSHLQGNLGRLLAAFMLCFGAACGKSHLSASGESHFVSCEHDAECTELGAGYACRAGLCEPAEDPPEPAQAAEVSSAGDLAIDAGSAAALDEGPAVPGAAEPPTQAGCGLHTPFAGDEACLPAPAADAGIQIHIGPSDYADPVALDGWVMDPGEETTECWSFKMPNAQDIAYAEWEFSARQGMHHTQTALYRVDVAEGQFELCRDLDAVAAGDLAGDLPLVSSTRVERAPGAPEQAAVRWPVAARAPAQASMHMFNFTDQPLVQEFWMNLYFAAPAASETARTLRAVGGAEWVIEPDTEVVERFECPIAEDGRLLSLMGRGLSSTRRLSAWLRRASGERVHVLETGIQEPWSYPYDSLTENPLLSEPSGGAFSGVLAFEAGDALEWECQIVNQTSGPLTHVGDELSGAICDMTGFSVGADIDCVLP